MERQAGERLGLDGSWLTQYGRWLGGVVRGDLGISIRQQRPVLDILTEALPNTLLLTSSALLVEILVGVLVGVAAARWPRRWWNDGPWSTPPPLA